MRNKKQIWITLGLIIVAMLVLNGSYFLAQIKYALNTKPAEPSIELPDNQERGEPNLLVIESLGITAPIVYTDATTEKGFQEALALGAVHYPGSAKIGEVGNAYVFGHSSDFLWKPGNYKNVFALLPKIQIGETIKVSSEEGIIYRYKVYETLIVNPNDLSVLNQDTGGKKILSVQTSYPIGTALKRFIVKAELQEVNQ